MKRKRFTLCLAVGLLLLLNGCQKTPEESAVVSKSDGLPEDSVLEPMKTGETREIDVPDHWYFSEKRSNDRVTITADLDMKGNRIGNLPIVEMKPHTLSVDELEKLVQYFCKW